MPHGQSWFSLGAWYQGLLASAQVFGGADGKTYYMHETVDVQHLLWTGVVLVLLTFLALVAYGKIKDAAKAIVPDGTLTIRNFVEVFVGTVYGMMVDIFGGDAKAHKAAKFFLPLIGTCAFFILAS